MKSEIENLEGLSNAFTLSADWLRIPYGDHPHARAIQRLTRAAGESLVANFASFSARLGRLFGGLPIYVGHPDDPNLANQFPDKKAYGWIMGMEARADGLYLKPKWSAAGDDLLANAFYKWFSPFWGCRPISDSGLASGVRRPASAIVEPVRLVSLGLTNSPNIQGILPLANENPSDPSNPSATQMKGVTKPMKEALIKLLGLANEATDEQILAGLNQLKADKDAADLALVNEKTAHAAASTQAAAASTAQTTAETALANEKTARTAKETALQAEITKQKKERIELVLANALAAGKITPAQKPQWQADLLALSNVEGGAANFDAKLVELSNAKPVMNTVSKTKNLGARNSNAVANRDATIRRDKVLMLVNERITKTSEGYESAFASIRKENPGLFDEMTQPAKK